MDVKTRLKKLWNALVAFYRRRIRPKSWKRVFLILGGTGASVIVIGCIVLLYYILRVPDPSIFLARRVNESTKIYDRTGTVVLYDVHGEEKRTVIAWDAIPENIKHATLAAEDSDFYQHSGVDIKGIFRAVWHDLLNLNAGEGGSTITQQLVKNVVLGKEKKLSRKIKEAVLAIQIERAFSKDYIFWMYLNQIPYGSNTYGIEAASGTFFGKSAKDLTLSEAATLAAMANAPTYYSPYGNHVDRLIVRRNYVLSRMQELGYITGAQYTEASSNEIGAKPELDRFTAPHFVIEVKKYLIATYGEDQVENGGLKVTTTLDLNLQNIASASVTKYGLINEKKYKATNAALVSMDPRTGQILAMVGSRDYFDTAHKGNYNVALSQVRQPGSSFKPFAYATAFGKGFSDSTILFDIPTEFNPSCPSTADKTSGSTGACYHPKDYSGTFVGPVTMRQALARSLNVPAVKTLYLAGIEDTLATARSMGVNPHNENDYFGLSLVLGGAGVSLLDMVSGYSVFANDGVREGATYILKIVSSEGAILEEYKPSDDRVLESQVTRMISDVLSDNDARSAVFGFNSSLVISGRPVAAKTGTTQNNRDGWIIGYTPSLVTGIWTGNNDDTPMTAAGAGLSAAGPMWNEFMSKALSGTKVEFFPKPDPSFSDKPMISGDFHDQNGEIHTILKYVDINDPLGPYPDNPDQDPQFKNWEASVERWAMETGQVFYRPTSSSSDGRLYIPPYDSSPLPTP